MDNIFNYMGQERQARRLLIDEKLATVEDVAVMTGGEVSDMIQEHYEVIFSQGEEILLVKKSDMTKFQSFAKFLYR